MRRDVESTCNLTKPVNYHLSFEKDKKDTEEKFRLRLCVIDFIEVVNINRYEYSQKILFHLLQVRLHW